MDYDRILVLDDGKVVEFDSISELLKNERGIFYSMVNNAGLLNHEQTDIENTRL